MEISLLGMGAVGKIYGGLLALSGHQVHFLARSEFAALEDAKFFNLDFQESHQTLKVNNPLIYNRSQDLPPSDLVIIALKTTENSNVKELLKTCLKKNTLVLIIQNGIGNEEYISQFTGQCPLICGITTCGAERLNALEVKVTFFGLLKLAPYFQKDLNYCEQIKELFASSPIKVPVEIVDNYKEIRWTKLAWNIPFGGLSLIFDQPSNVLAKKEPFLTIVKKIIEEIKMIALSENVVISDEFIAKMLEATKNSKDYIPTLARDFNEGKAIEKEYLFDNVLAVAQKNKLNVPLLTVLEKQLASMQVLGIEK